MKKKKERKEKQLNEVNNKTLERHIKFSKCDYFKKRDVDGCRGMYGWVCAGYVEGNHLKTSFSA